MKLTSFGHFDIETCWSWNKTKTLQMSRPHKIYAESEKTWKRKSREKFEKRQNWNKTLQMSRPPQISIFSYANISVSSWESSSLWECHKSWIKLKAFMTSITNIPLPPFTALSLFMFTHTQAVKLWWKIMVPQKKERKKVAGKIQVEQETWTDRKGKKKVFPRKWQLGEIK